MPLVRAESSGIREIAQAARKVPGAIRLDTGEPNFRTPQHIADAGKRAIDNGLTHYTDTQGILPLREALKQKLHRVNGIRAESEQIVCGPGGVGVLAAALASVVSNGDEILLPDPGWPNTSIMATWLGAREIRYPCRAADGYMPDLQFVKQAITARTRVLLINSPNNPTGAVYPESVLAELGALAERNNMWVVADECYDQIVFGEAAAAPSVAAFVDRERLIVGFTFSKTYAMTGWRLGYAVAPDQVAESMVKFLQSTSSSVSSITQWAGVEALTGSQDCVAEMVGAYRRRRDLAVALLTDADLPVTRPEGAFYIMVGIEGTGLTARQFALELLAERKVSVSPGSAFGKVADQAVRVSLASSDEDLVEGIKRLLDFSAQRQEAKPR
jgi:aspartate aminotransferase